MDRRRKPRQTNLLPAGIGDTERLEAPAHVVAIDLFLAGQALRAANRLCDQRRVENGAVIEVLADLVLRRDLALTLVNDIFEDVLDRGIVLADAIDAERTVALGFRAGVVVAPRPPYADQPI